MGNRSLEGGQPKKQNWLRKGQITKKVSVKLWMCIVHIFSVYNTQYSVCVF